MPRKANGSPDIAGSRRLNASLECSSRTRSRVIVYFLGENRTNSRYTFIEEINARTMKSSEAAVRSIVHIDVSKSATLQSPLSGAAFNAMVYYGTPILARPFLSFRHSAVNKTSTRRSAN